MEVVRLELRVRLELAGLGLELTGLGHLRSFTVIAVFYSQRIQQTRQINHICMTAVVKRSLSAEALPQTLTNVLSLAPARCTKTRLSFPTAAISVGISLSAVYANNIYLSILNKNKEIIFHHPAARNLSILSPLPRTERVKQETLYLELM